MPVPNDIYDNDVDFTTLALQYPDFAKKLKHNRQLDFTDPDSVRQLTKALLHRDFDITIDLPEDRLCPPVPNRFNYILFVQRLLDCTSPTFRDSYDPNRQVIGLDIGTGASAVYPLLACRQRPKWLFLATEIDAKSRSYATRNIKANNLDSRIKVLDTDPNGVRLIPLEELERFERIDILLTNPPFYASTTSMHESAKLKSRPPNSSCTGADVEMIYPFPAANPSAAEEVEGGEVLFVTSLLSESMQPSLQHKIQWFSAMLGKLSSVATVVEKLRERGCGNYAVTEFIQGSTSGKGKGNKTRRWAVAWSWMGLRPLDVVGRGILGGGLERRLLPGSGEVEFEVGDVEVGEMGRRVDAEICTLAGVQWRFKADLRVGVGMSREGDVWSRKARRKKEREMGDVHMKTHDEEGEDEDEEDEDEKEPALVFKISVRPVSLEEGKMGGGGSKAQVHVRWLQGQDPVLFESFCGWLKRKVSL